jgi:hypothetical protein
VPWKIKRERAMRWGQQGQHRIPHVMVERQPVEQNHRASARITLAV